MLNARTRDTYFAYGCKIDVATLFLVRKTLTGVGWTAHFQRVRTAWHVFVIVLDGENVPSALLWFDEQGECAVAMIEQSAERCLIQTLTVGGQLAWTCATRIDDTLDLSAEDA